MRVLLTGARAPATLELARLCARAGHEVHLADSVRWHVGRGSRLVAASHVVPPARDRIPWLAALNDVIRIARIDVVVPTCEELFHLAAVKDGLAARVDIEPLTRLEPLHDKWRFVGACEAAGVATPPTCLLESGRDATRLASGRYMLKRRFSRFAHAVVPWRTGDPLPPLGGIDDARWVAQSRLDGEALCTWSVAHQGRLLAHGAYVVLETAGAFGAAICFRSVRHEGATAWVARFIAHHRLSGQFAFDFIETSAGLFALECNPRLTSGIHLFRDQHAVASLLLAPERSRAEPMLEPPAGRVFRSRLALAMYRKPMHAGAGLLDATDDPWPRRLQFIAWSDLLVRSALRGVDPRALGTADIEWNGE